ncbi:hypothetical protein CK203_040439 [Vitis vinifera]|uniref:Uncharacterized protein n=1 Tax=Vitis vinifera TaxID=29760 RepID=A0A438I831_VITVI|nr:hypothetical protein CK203_040439 [Vitis vinifera]
MDEDEFHRLLELFPIVRSRDYHVIPSLLKSFSPLQLWHESKDFKSQSNTPLLTFPSLITFAFFHYLHLSPPLDLSSSKLKGLGINKFRRTWNHQDNQLLVITRWGVLSQQLKGQNSLDEGNGREIEIQGINLHDAFWEKLKVVAERKIEFGKYKGLIKIGYALCSNH